MNNSDLSDDEVKADDLTWREQDILFLLADRLTNREIANRLNLAESTVKDYVGKILAKLYVKNRRQAVERGQALGLLNPHEKKALRSSSNLPSQPTPFIGRIDELDQIKESFDRTRLLTLTGPGGIGKTRLALKAGQESEDAFEDGVFFVSLAPIRSAADIVQTIAETLNISLAAHESPRAQLLHYLKNRKLLLVMDNLEHLQEAAPIVGEILRSTTNVKILATSREKLNLHSETALTIRGMDVTDDPVSSSAQNDAITLFLQSTRKAYPGFDPSPEESAWIVQVCRMVQGMPLAIELAAAWMQILSVREIVEQLEYGIDILAADVRDEPQRHQSIRTVFDHSWSLLNRTDQAIFLSLSVFHGGFTRDAAQYVSGANLHELMRLANKSFLSYDPTSGRFEIHELLRQYAQARLEEIAGAKDAAREKHAAYYGKLMQEKWEHLKDRRQRLALKEIEADIENLRAAWRCSLDQRDASKLQLFIHGLWLVYYVRGWNYAGKALFRQAVESLEGVQGDAQAEIVRAIAQANEGFFLAWLGLADQGYPLAKESVEILEKLDDLTGLVMACNSLSINTYYMGLSNEEKPAVEKVIRMAGESGDRWVLALALYLESMALFRVKNYQKAKSILEGSLNIGEELGEGILSAWSRTALGQIALLQGGLAESKAHYARVLDEARQMGYSWALGNSIKYLGKIALLEGNVSEAENYLSQSLRIANELGLDRDIANHLLDFARLRVAQNRPFDAARLLTHLDQLPASRQARLGQGTIRDSGNTLLKEIVGGFSPEDLRAYEQQRMNPDLDGIIADLAASVR